MNRKLTKVIASLLCAIMLLSAMPLTAFAVNDYTAREDDYYNLISKKDWDLAPGVTESEIVLNNDAGTHRQVAHVVEVDINNPYTKVMPSYRGMAEGLESKKYGVQIMSEQVAYAEANGYGNVVAAMNLSLNWYNGEYYRNHPELIGEPLGYLVMDGVQYTNSQGQTGGAATCLVINFDEKDGTARPKDLPKVQIRSTSDKITGWEEQVIPANFGFLVKDGKNQFSENHTADPASRSFVGIKADGTIVMVMNDGRQSPYSIGFNSYEMAEFMLSLGCVQAINGDGGGSSAFLSQRPGEDMELHCSPSDGGERATTHGILVISTAPSDGTFVRASVETEGRYFTPNSTVKFTAKGADLAGTAVEIPETATWTLSDESFGTIDENGIFKSNGKIGAVSAQITYEGEVVGSCEINIVLPDSVAFRPQTLTVPYGKTSAFTVSAYYGAKEVVTKDNDFELTLSNANMGTLSGYELTATTDESISGGSITVKVKDAPSVKAVLPVVYGKASEVVYDFENGFADDWQVEFIQKRKMKFNNGWKDGAIECNNLIKSYSVSSQNGMVHDGNGAGAVYMDSMYTTNNIIGATIYWLKDTVEYKNAHLLVHGSISLKMQPATL